MEHIIGLKEFRMNVEKYAKATEGGYTVIVMRRSKPLFKVAPVDDESMWETVVDFTRIKKGGVDIEDILSRV